MGAEGLLCPKERFQRLIGNAQTVGDLSRGRGSWLAPGGLSRRKRRRGHGAEEEQCYASSGKSVSMLHGRWRLTNRA